jgi:hypothetical protein
MIFYFMRFNICHYKKLYYQTLLSFYINENMIRLISNFSKQLNKLPWSSKTWLKPTLPLLNCTNSKQSLVINTLYQFNSFRNINKFILFTSHNFSNSNRILLKKISLNTSSKNCSNYIRYWLGYLSEFYRLNLNLNFHLQTYFTTYRNNLLIQKIINKNWINNLTNKNRFNTNLNIIHTLKHI